MSKKALSAMAVAMIAAVPASGCTHTNRAVGTLHSLGASVELRSDLTALFGEHTYLTALATEASLRGDPASLAAWRTELSGTPTSCAYGSLASLGSCTQAKPGRGLSALIKDGPKAVYESNSADLVSVVSYAYGAQQGQRFASLWASQAYLPAILAYTRAVASGDTPGAAKATADLNDFARTFGAQMHALNAALPAARGQQALTAQVAGLKAVIDAQRAQDEPAVYANLRRAYHSLDGFAQSLAAVTVAKFPQRFKGPDPNSKASALQAGLTSQLQEWALLTASSSGAMIGGRPTEAQAALHARDDSTHSNTSDLVATVGSVYGARAGDQFDTLWRGINAAWLTYEQPLLAIPAGASLDQAQSLEASASNAITYNKYLDAYTGKFFQPFNPDLPAAEVANAFNNAASFIGPVMNDQAQRMPDETAAALRLESWQMVAMAQVITEGTAAKLGNNLRGQG